MRRFVIFCAIALALTLGTGASAGAQAVCGSVTPCVPPVEVGGDVVDDGSDPGAVDLGRRAVEVAGDVSARRPGSVASDVSGALPVTGSDLVGLTAIGLGAMAIGGLLVRQRRRRTTA